MSQEANTERKTAKPEPRDGRIVRHLALALAFGYSVTVVMFYVFAPHLVSVLAVQVVWVLSTIFAVATYMARRTLDSAPLNPDHESHRMPSRRMQKWMTSNHA